MEFTTEELALIDALYKKNDPWSPALLYIHSILNSKPLEQVIQHYLTEKHIIKQFESNVLRRVSERSFPCGMYEQLIDEFTDSNYIKRCRIRKILFTIEEQLTEEQLLEIYSILINSKFIYDYQTALRIAPKIWNDEIEAKLKGLFELSRDPMILESFITAKKFSFLSDIIEEIWKGNADYNLKKYFFRNFKEINYDALKFLERYDPFNFLKASFIHGIKLTHDQIKENFLRITDKDTLTYAIGLISKMGYIEIVLPHIRNFAFNFSTGDSF